MAAAGMQFPWRSDGGTISLNLDVIWGMSDQVQRSFSRKENAMPSNPGFITKLIDKNRKGLLSHFIYERVRNSLAKVGLKISLFIVFEERPLGGSDPSVALADCRLDLLSEADMPELAAVEGYGYSSTDLVTRLQNRSLCVALRHQEKIVAFTWCDTENRRHKILPIELSENEAFLYDAYTAKAYRGKNLIVSVRHRAYEELEKIGRFRFLSTSDFFNKPAIRFKKKLHAVPLQLVFYICLFNKIEKKFALKEYKPRSLR